MLRVEDLTIRFGGLVAVNSLNFEIERGEIFGLIGPNGAGKTTTFNMISGTFPPTSGKITLEGKRIDGLPMFKVNQLGIARTYQNINLMGTMTAVENVMIGQHSHVKSTLLDAILRTGKQRKEEAAVLKNAYEWLDYVGLQKKAEHKADALAYGEQRLLEIARALASHPKLLLLDEPAAGMNPSEKNSLAELIQRIRADGVTVLVVEHDMKFLMNLVDCVCVLNFGERLALGTPAEVQNDQAVVEAYLGGDGA